MRSGAGQGPRRRSGPLAISRSRSGGSASLGAPPAEFPMKLHLSPPSPRRRPLPALAIDPPADGPPEHGRAGRAAPGPCRPARRAHPAVAAGAGRGGDFRALHLCRLARDRASARRRSGSTARCPAARGCSSSAGSGARSSPRSRIPASAPPAPAADEQEGVRHSLRLSRRSGWATSPPRRADGRLLVDISSFLTRDDLNIARRAARAGRMAITGSCPSSASPTSISSTSSRATSSSRAGSPSSARGPGPRSPISRRSPAMSASSSATR